jgi:threonine aldolase
MDPAAVGQAIDEAKLRHRPHTSLVCLENTHNVAGGTILDAAHIEDVASVAHDLGARVHVDGARIFNACVALEVDLATLLSPVDTAVLNLNKGLSAPGGALLVGSADFVERARVNLKRIGGSSFHQAGIIAAAGLVALRTMIPQLADDNRRAALLASLVDRVDGLTVDLESVQTNIVMVSVDARLGTGEGFLEELAAAGVRAYLAAPQALRFITHRHVDDVDVANAAEAIAAVAARAGVFA